MRQLPFILISAIVVLASCQDSKSNFDYDPTVPYPLMNSGDFWVDKFDQRGLQNAIVYHDKLYCNTIDVGGNSNYLYCLNPKNGLVVWRSKVDAYATQPVSFQHDTIIYCSFLGRIFTFDSTGKILWKAKFDYPYGGHWVDTNNSKLLVKTVGWKYVAGFDIKSGNLALETKSDSLQKIIAHKMEDAKQKETFEYTFVQLGKKYTIKCRPFKENGGYKIEIID